MQHNSYGKLQLENSTLTVHSLCCWSHHQAAEWRDHHVEKNWYGSKIRPVL